MTQVTTATPREPATSVRGIVVLLADWLFISLGFFMLFPLLSVHFAGELGFSAGLIGAVLAVRQIVQQGFMTFGGAIADQVGRKPMIVLGMVVRAAGMLVFAFAESAAALFIAAVVSGLGGLMFDASHKAALAGASAPGPARQRSFALWATISSVGATVGPLIGVYLLRFDFQVVGVVAATSFLAGALSTLILLPARQELEARSPGIGETLRLVQTVAVDLRFVKYTAALTCFFFLHVQLYIALPLAALALTGSNDSTGYVYALSFGQAILLQYPIARLAARRIPPFTIIAIGLALMGLGLLLAGTAGSFPLMLLFVALYGFGRLLIEPVSQNVISEIAPAGMLGAYYGFANLGFAIGGSLGNALGGTLFDLSNRLGMPAAIWLFMAVVGVTGAAAMLWIGRSLAPPGREEATVSTPIARRHS